MGLCDFLSFGRNKFPKAFRPLDWALFEGCLAFIDAAGGVYNGIASREPGDDVNFLRFMVNKALYLKTLHNITAVYVVDGERNQAKRAEEEWRAKNKEARRKTIDAQAAFLKATIDEVKELLDAVPEDDSERPELVQKYEALKRDHAKLVDAPTLSVNKKHYDNLIKLLVEEGLLYVVSKTEAEKCCAWATKNGFAHVVISDDSDCLAYGAPVTIFNVWCSDRSASRRPKYFVVYEELLKEMGLDRDQFVQMSALMHNDYNRNSSLRGMGPATAYEAIKKHKTIEAWKNSPDFGLFVSRRNLKQEEIEAWDPSAALKEFGESDDQISGLHDATSFYKACSREDLALEAVANIFETNASDQNGEGKVDIDDLKAKFRKIFEEASVRKVSSVELGRILASFENPGLKKAAPTKRPKSYKFGGLTDLQRFEEREREEDKEQIAKRSRMLTLD